MNDENPKLQLAHEYVENTSSHIFLTGKAGTGKTTFLRHIVETSLKRLVVTAPTGVAAINAGGVTLHSFFQLPFGMCLPGYQHTQAFQKEGMKFHKSKIKIIRSLELLIIDEISMVRADLLDEIDSVLRRLRRSSKPFGGVQVLMIGDLQQLAPVVREQEWEVMKDYYASPYFFDSNVLRSNAYIRIELDHIYRQRDPKFINLLEAVRDNQMSEEIVTQLNARYNPKISEKEEDDNIMLTTHNHISDKINNDKLAALKGKKFEFKAKIVDNFPEKMYPQDPILVLKKGAKVMFTKNDPDVGKRFVNGTLGTVTDISRDFIEVTTKEGNAIEVEVAFWENLKYNIDEASKEIVSDIDGLFYQYPLKLAWAITIHKSQGLTFDKAIIDAGASFSHGQVYVALSRCRTLEGITLRTPIYSHAVKNDFTVVTYNQETRSNCPTLAQLEQDKRGYFLLQLSDLFNLDDLKKHYFKYLGFAESAAKKLYPKAVKTLDAAKVPLTDEFFVISEKFQRSLQKLVTDEYLTDEHLQERIIKAAIYFKNKWLEILFPALRACFKFTFDGKDDSKIQTSYYKMWFDEAALKWMLWEDVKTGFQLEEFLKKKAHHIIQLTDISQYNFFTSIDKKEEKEEKKEKASAPKKKQRSNADVEHPALFEKLRAWRIKKAKESGLLAYQVAQQSALLGLANFPPSDKDELSKIKGIGKIFISKYGTEVLEICSEYLSTSQNIKQQKLSFK